MSRLGLALQIVFAFLALACIGMAAFLLYQRDRIGELNSMGNAILGVSVIGSIVFLTLPFLVGRATRASFGRQRP
jgi:hypothetical protein